MSVGGSSGAPGEGGRRFEGVERGRKLVVDAVKSRDVATILFLVFVGTAAFTFYLLAVPWIGLGQTSYPVAEGSALVAAVSLFLNRMMTRSPLHTMLRSLLLALADTLVFAGFVGLATWTLVFPLLQPFPSAIVMVGVFSLIFTSAMFVVLRFVQPSQAGRGAGAYSDVEVTLKHLGDAVEELSKRLPHDTRDVDPAVAERISSMMSEVAAMRKEFANLRTGAPSAGGPAYVANPQVSGQREAPTITPRQARPQIEAHRGAPTPRPQVGVPEEAASPPLQEGGQLVQGVPDSAVDNPWLDVLGRRRKKAQ